jgi:hypothetical protein
MGRTEFLTTDGTDFTDGRGGEVFALAELVRHLMRGKF